MAWCGTCTRHTTPSTPPSVAFGDVSASVFLELVKELAGVLGVEIDAEPSKKIGDDGYVDDNLGGG